MRLKREKPAWGRPKVTERLAQHYPDVMRPLISTVHAVLDRHGLVERRRDAVTGRGNGPLGRSRLQGEFMVAERRFCYPLTITRLRQPLWSDT